MDYREYQKMLDPAYLKTVSMNEIYETVFESRPPLVDGLLYSGTYLFVGAPKLGKSFFMAQLAYHISTGIPLWNYTIRKGTVLYLALEDDYRRLQERMYRMFGTADTACIYRAVTVCDGCDDVYDSGCGTENTVTSSHIVAEFRGYPSAHLRSVSAFQRGQEELLAHGLFACKIVLVG